MITLTDQRHLFVLKLYTNIDMKTVVREPTSADHNEPPPIRSNLSYIHSSAKLAAWQSILTVQ